MLKLLAVGFVDKVALGQVFLRALRFPLPIRIPLTASHTSSIIRGWYNRPNGGSSIRDLVPPNYQ
jgi:hypothetical protein